MAEVLVLDAAISDWVLIPLSVVMMVLIGFLGYVISNLTDSSESPDDNSKIVKTYMPLARNLRAKSFRANEVLVLGEFSTWMILSKMYMSRMKQSACTITTIVFFIGTHSPIMVFFGELVLSFDICTEFFLLTLLPEMYTEFTHFWSFRECHLALLGDSLAANFSLCYKNRTTIEVWVMKKAFNRLVKAGESFSSYRWSQEFTVELPQSLYTCITVGFWNKNELLIWTDVQVFDLRSRGRGRGAPLLYHMVTKQARDLQISGWGYFWSFLVIMVVSTCVEFFLVGNLVLLFHSVDYMKFYSCTSH
ncbi:uncharacterized protein LOC131301947 isoform X2 [Rhododendron vialii]|uniref:uncharacterized protein LOC131301947 isoform X2 n=1 Tax=Rhododendron vialii TaxID=182163 RepID=UPI0026602EE3|nr:uncharacterized protein LOC131301947 isoform X2 [Rhododendron vialii]